jgi:pimeloyl-ACP methyl ester carboxylesterase
MRDRRGRRFRPRRLAALAVGGAAAAGLAIERRHLRRVARDPDYARLSVPLNGLQRTVRSADGTRLHVRIFGPDDAPTIVLAHGWTEALGFWSDVIANLSARRLRLVAYDLRGHGNSDRASDGDYSLRRFGEDVEAILAACVPAGGEATLAGHSLGAMSIAAWAEHHDVRRRAFGPAATIGQVAFYERMLIACPTDVRAACGVAMCDMDLHEAVARLTVPTLVIAGACDRLTPPAHPRRIVAMLAQPAGLLVLPDTGHMSPLERPTECSDALHQLIAQRARTDHTPDAGASGPWALPERSL